MAGCRILHTLRITKTTPPVTPAGRMKKTKPAKVNIADQFLRSILQIPLLLRWLLVLLVLGGFG